MGDNVLISCKDLSKDRTKRYKLKLEIELVDEKSTCKKANSGETMLMTEDWESGLEAGNIIEIHLKTMKKYIKEWEHGFQV